MPLFIQRTKTKNLWILIVFLSFFLFLDVNFTETNSEWFLILRLNLNLHACLLACLIDFHFSFLFLLLKRFMNGYLFRCRCDYRSLVGFLMCLFAMRGGYFLPDFLIPPVTNGPFCPAFAFNCSNAFFSACCFALKSFSSSVISLASFFGAFNGFFLPPSRPDIVDGCCCCCCSIHKKSRSSQRNVIVQKEKENKLKLTKLSAFTLSFYFKCGNFQNNKFFIQFLLIFMKKEFNKEKN